MVFDDLIDGGLAERSRHADLEFTALGLDDAKILEDRAVVVHAGESIVLVGDVCGENAERSLIVQQKTGGVEQRYSELFGTDVDRVILHRGERLHRYKVLQLRLLSQRADFAGRINVA